MKVQITESGNVKIVLTQAQANDVWTVLANSHKHTREQAKLECAVAEGTSLDVCCALSNILEYKQANVGIYSENV